MRLPTIGLTVLALVAALWGTAPAQADPERGGVPLDDLARSAVKVLEDVQETLADPDTTEITTALVQLHEVYDDLPADERREAKALLARPTDATHNPIQDLINYGGITPSTTCGTRFCVHWTESGKHRADPAWVTTTLDVLDQVWTSEIDNLGYRRPTSDGTVGNPPGNTTGGLVDVYLGELVDDGYYGYANWDPSSSKAGYLVLDNDFVGLRVTPLKALKATAAHEFFHIVQFAYRRKVDPWLMESTAAWIEEVVFTEANDNRQYLRYSSLRLPRQVLDEPSIAVYGNWIFFEYLSKKYGNAVVRDIWQRSAKAQNHSTKAINKALKARGSNLADTFADFSAANLTPGRTYSEGSAYPKPLKNKVRKLSTKKKSTGWLIDRLDHLTASHSPVKASGKLGKKWRLRVDVQRTDKRQRARVVVHRTDGRVNVKTVKMKGNKGKATVKFGAADVKRVTVTLINGSARYACKKGTPYACKGKPKDDNQKFTFRARLVKRS